MDHIVATSPAIDRRKNSLAGAPEPVDFARWIGTEGWWRLAPDIRTRFSAKPAADRPIRYRGVMHRVDCSAAGWCLAQCFRLFGTPFAPWRGADVPVDITLHHAGDGAIEWERTYRYAGRAPVVVTSVKRGDADGLRECVDHGLGMRLAVFEANRALHFLSLFYFATFAGRRFRLPSLLTPGTAHVIHTDLGDGRFRFTMTIHHAWFGTLFHQDGVFHASPADEGALQ